jgi:hypothetical protein
LIPSPDAEEIMDTQKGISAVVKTDIVYGNIGFQSRLKNHKNSFVA